MTNDDAIFVMEYYKLHFASNEKAVEAFDMAISSLEQKHCNDAISRRMVLDATVNKNSIWNNITNAKGENLEKIILQLPSVNQLNKWIGAEVLDRIRNEMHATAEKHEDGVYYLRDEWVDEIIDKYAEGSDKE